jgi:hypothetical protein
MAKSTKTNVEKLQTILSTFDEETIQAVFGSREQFSQSENIIIKSISDFKDFTGEKVEVNSECRVKYEDLPALERIIGDNNFLPVHFLVEGSIIQRAVARVVIKNNSGAVVSHASGFMVSPTLFLTNNHVFGSIAEAKPSAIEFNYQDDFNGAASVVDTFSLDPDNVFYTNASLDFTLVRVAPKYSLVRREYYFQDEFTPNPDGPINPPFTPNLPPFQNPPFTLPPDFRLPRFYTIKAGEKWGFLRLLASLPISDNQHVNIIQHPRGRKKEVCLQENKIDDIYTNVVRYTTDTDPGSSGSPVFNNSWDVIALHHAGGEQNGGVWINNEGIRIDKIITNLRSNFNGTPTGNAILAELGI